MPRLVRLEWISLLYLALFVLAILSPSFVTGDVLWFSEEQVEEMLIFLFGVTGLITFNVYERVMERKDHERDQAISDRDRVRRELVSSYEYIGAVNRRIEALKKLANETVDSLDETDSHSKGLFQSIAAHAAALIRAQHGVVRIVHLKKLRTIKEFLVDPEARLRIANKELLEVHERNRSHCFIRDEQGAEVLVIPSSRRDMDAKVFLMLRIPEHDMPEIDPEILRVYANQAEILYRVLSAKAGESSS